MKKERSLIEVIKPPPGAFYDNLDHLNIGPVRNVPARYRNIDTNEEFVHLAGALAWPGKDLPGFALVIGVRIEEETPVLVSLDEAENYHVEGLLSECLILRSRYGFRRNHLLFRPWWGDSQRFSPLLTRFNDQIREEEPEGIYLANPLAFERENRFELYLHRIQSALNPNPVGRKSLVLGNCHRLRNAIQNLPRDAAQRFTEDDSPAVFALGALVHAILSTQPWALIKSSVQPASHDSVDEWERYVLSQTEHARFGEKVSWQQDIFVNDVE